MLTDRGDTVLDFFAGSNTTGAAAEMLGRKWTAFENNLGYLAASAFRFTERSSPEKVESLYSKLISEEINETYKIKRAVQLQFIDV